MIEAWWQRGLLKLPTKINNVLCEVESGALYGGLPNNQLNYTVVAATNYRTGDTKGPTDRTDYDLELICNRAIPYLAAINSLGPMTWISRSLACQELGLSSDQLPTPGIRTVLLRTPQLPIFSLLVTLNRSFQSAALMPR